MLCRISNEILKIHKFRVHRSFPGNPGWRVHHENDQAKKDVENLRKVYSGEPVENEPPPPPAQSLGQFLQVLRSAVL
jgi:hypothetical protein